MKAFRASLLYLCVGSTLCGQPRPNRNNAALLLQHVTVIDSTGTSPRANMSVLIVGDRIKSISPAGRLAKPVRGVITVDATGKFLIAGLWDMHVHALSKNEPERFFPLFIANGVTGIREAGKVANLVLLDANPLEDIRNTQKIRGVILRGNFLDRPKLDELLAQRKLNRDSDVKDFHAMYGGLLSGGSRARRKQLRRPHSLE